MIPIFIINLENHPKNYQRCLNELEKVTDLNNVHRFNAINGNNMNINNYDNHLYYFSKKIYSKKLIAIALSHILLCKYLYENYDNEYFLICEDDIKIEFNDDLQEKLYKIIKNYPKDFDIINLNWTGICTENKRSKKNCGSTACYLISRKGCLKKSKLKIYHHIDLQRNKDLITYTGPNLVNTYERNCGIKLIDNSKIKIGYKPLRFWINSTPKINIYGISIPDIFFDLFLYLLLIFIIIIIIKYIYY